MIVALHTWSGNIENKHRIPFSGFIHGPEIKPCTLATESIARHLSEEESLKPQPSGLKLNSPVTSLDDLLDVGEVDGLDGLEKKIVTPITRHKPIRADFDFRNMSETLCVSEHAQKPLVFDKLSKSAGHRHGLFITNTNVCAYISTLMHEGSLNPVSYTLIIKYGPFSYVPLLPTYAVVQTRSIDIAQNNAPLQPYVKRLDSLLDANPLNINPKNISNISQPFQQILDVVIDGLYYAANSEGYVIPHISPIQAHNISRSYGSFSSLLFIPILPLSYTISYPIQHETKLAGHKNIDLKHRILVANEINIDIARTPADFLYQFPTPESTVYTTQAKPLTFYVSNINSSDFSARISCLFDAKDIQMPSFSPDTEIDHPVPEYVPAKYSAQPYMYKKGYSTRFNADEAAIFEDKTVIPAEPRYHYIIFNKPLGFLPKTKPNVAGAFNSYKISNAILFYIDFSDRLSDIPSLTEDLTTLEDYEISTTQEDALYQEPESLESCIEEGAEQDNARVDEPYDSEEKIKDKREIRENSIQAQKKEKEYAGDINTNNAKIHYDGNAAEAVASVVGYGLFAGLAALIAAPAAVIGSIINAKIVKYEKDLSLENYKEEKITAKEIKPIDGEPAQNTYDIKTPESTKPEASQVVEKTPETATEPKSLEEIAKTSEVNVADSQPMDDTVIPAPPLKIEENKAAINPNLEALKSDLSNIVEKLKADYKYTSLQVHVSNIRGDYSASVDSNTPGPGPCLMKIPLVAAVLEFLQENSEVYKEGLQTKLAVGKEVADLKNPYHPTKERYDRLTDNGKDKGAIVEFTVEELLRYMIIRSDNGAYNSLIKGLLGGGDDKLGLKRFDEFNIRKGYPELHAEDLHLMGRNFEKSMVVPEAVGRLLRSIYQGTFSSKENSAYILSLLQQATSTLDYVVDVSSLPSGMRVYAAKPTESKNNFAVTALIGPEANPQELYTITIRATSKEEFFNDKFEGNVQRHNSNRECMGKLLQKIFGYIKPNNYNGNNLDPKTPRTQST